MELHVQEWEGSRMNRGEDRFLRLPRTISCCPATWGRPKRQAKLSQGHLMTNHTQLEPADRSRQQSLPQSTWRAEDAQAVKEARCWL